MAKEKYRKKPIPLNGKLISGRDPATIGNNFRQLTNMRYEDTHPQGVLGMTKINTTALSNVQTRSGFHFRKENPAESHVLVQSFDGSGTNPVIYENETAIPSAGDFNVNPVMTDDTDASTGQFSSAPNGNVMYCNKEGAYIWGGDEMTAAAMVTSTAAITDTITDPKDYSDQVKNDRTDSKNRAVIGGGGVDGSKTIGLWHFNAADTVAVAPFIDDATANNHDWTVNGDVQADIDQVVFGQSSALFDGDGDYLSINDHANFDYGSGTMTIDMRVRFAASGTNLIIDDGNTDHTSNITDVADPVLSSSIKKWGTDSLQLNGTTQYLSIADHADWDVFNSVGAADDYNIDCWVYLDTTAGIMPIVGQYANASNYWMLLIQNGVVKFQFMLGGTLRVNLSGGTVSAATWTHIAFAKVANVGDANYDTGIYVDGTMVDFDNDDTSVGTLAVPLMVGHYSIRYFDGYIDELRIENNNAFSADPKTDPNSITVPTAAHTSTATTHLLLHMDADTSGGAQHCLYSQSDTDPNDFVAFWYDWAEGKIKLYAMDEETMTFSESASWSPSLKTWYHIALIRGWGGGANDWAITVDGTAIHTFTNSSAWPDLDGDIVIGSLKNTVFIDEGANGHDISPVNNAITKNDQEKWGQGSAYFDGATDALQLTDHADWDLCADITTEWSVECQVRMATHAGTDGFISQWEDPNNYWTIENVHGTGLQFVLYNDVGGASAKITATGTEIADSNWHHVLLIKTDDTYSLYDNGTRIATTTTAQTDTLAGDLYIGQRGTAANTDLQGHIDEVRIYQGNPFGAASETTITVPTEPHTSDGATTRLLIHCDNMDFNGHIDELRISKAIARWTENFDVPATSYPDDDFLWWVVGTTRPIQGIKYYVQVGSNLNGTISVQEWNGNSWDTLTSGDGTAGMANTGWITWNDTQNTSKIKYLNNQLLYWYQFIATACDAEVYKITVDAPMQQVKDIWDGVERECLSFQVYDNTTFENNTTNVYRDEYSSTNTATYSKIVTGFATATDYVVAGFSERQTGLIFNFVPGNENTAAAVMTVSFWDGKAWVTVGTIQDGTDNGGDSWGKSGIVTWNVPSEEEEFKREINNEAFLYYYKVNFNANLTEKVAGEGIRIYYIAGVPAQKIVNSYSFPVHSSDRLWLLSEQDGLKNRALATAPGTAEVFNGSEIYDLLIGDESEIIAGAPLYMQLSSNLYDALVVCKKSETWLVVPSTSGISKFLVDNKIGCVAPGTMRSLSTAPSETGENKSVIIWQGANGIYKFDARTPVLISQDISDIFDKSNSSSINTSMIDRSMSFFDYEKQEYHWLYASGSSTTLNKEWVYDIGREKWFEIARGTTLNCGIEVADTSGNTYTYGCTHTGYMERLENGTDFDGTAIAHTLWLGDLLLSDDITDLTRLEVLNLIGAAKNTTTSDITVSHFLDTATTARKTDTISPDNSAGRLFSKLTQVLGGGHVGIFHGFKFTISTDNETIGFEPIGLTAQYRYERDWKSGGSK